jgi:hypothetical protein
MVNVCAGQPAKDDLDCQLRAKYRLGKREDADIAPGELIVFEFDRHGKMCTTSCADTRYPTAASGSDFECLFKRLYRSSASIDKGVPVSLIQHTYAR